MEEDDLLAEIEAFLAETGMGASYFGKRATGNSELVERLRRRGTTPQRGRAQSITFETARQCRRFIAEYRQGTPATAREVGATPMDETTHFGDRTVRLDEKQDLVDAVFHGVADRYDLMNDLMSGGVHRLWKDVLVNRLAPPRMGTRPYRVLDVAGGTGDIAERVVNASVGYAEVTVADINADMLRVGAERARSWRFPGQVTFVEANAENLPFDDDSFDAYTIAFGIRNVPRIDRALAEAHRVLKRGGRFLCLEFSQPDLPGLEAAYRLYSDTVIPSLGTIVTGDGQPYQYLVESIRQFPEPARFSAMIAAAGFRRVAHTPMTGNVAALHAAWKI